MLDRLQLIGALGRQSPAGRVLIFEWRDEGGRTLFATTTLTEPICLPLVIVA